MDPINYGAIAIAAISAWSAYASQRASAKANNLNNKQDAEKDAYSRARSMDIQTIERQDAEILELSQTVRDLRAQIEELRSSLQTERRRNR